MTTSAERDTAETVFRALFASNALPQEWRDIVNNPSKQEEVLAVIREAMGGTPPAPAEGAGTFAQGIEAAINALPGERDPAPRSLDDLAGPNNPVWDRGWNAFREKAIRRLCALTPPDSTGEPGEAEVESALSELDTLNDEFWAIAWDGGAEDTGVPADKLAPLEARWEAAFNTIRSALRSRAPESAREGWVLVPAEPTPEMQKAGANTFGGQGDNVDARYEVSVMFRAMLAAAPTQPDGDTRERG